MYLFSLFQTFYTIFSWIEEYIKIRTGTTLSADSIHLLLCIIYEKKKYKKKTRLYCSMNEKKSTKEAKQNEKMVKLCLEDLFSIQFSTCLFKNLKSCCIYNSFFLS